MAYIGNAPATGENNSVRILDDITTYTLTFDGSSSSVVSTSDNTISYINHRFITGQRVTYNDGGGTGLEVVAVDNGPGIPDVDQAMRDGFSTGKGLGAGLGGAKRLVDEFEIESTVGKGTRVAARKWLWMDRDRVGKLQDKYSEILESYIETYDERYLFRVSELAKQFLEAKVGPDEVAEMHSRVLTSLI